VNVVIATTGTGGDLFPGVAVAEALRKKQGVSVRFVVSGLGQEEEVLRSHRFSFDRLHVGRLKGESKWSRSKTLFGLPLTIARSGLLLKRVQADVVLGSGGHTSGPMLLAACLLRLPRAIMEPNTRPGLTNRILALLVSRIYTGFPGSEYRFPKQKALGTGVPIRPDLSALPLKTGRDFTVLVLGGSRGAVRLNTILLETVPHLARSGRKVRILHQTGRVDFERARGLYDRLGALREWVDLFPFRADIRKEYAEADLVIARAGASTIAELTALGKPAILIPYPFAADDHQTANASWFVEQGGGEVILEKDLDHDAGKKIADRILYYERNGEALKMISDKIGRLKRGNAAEEIAVDLIRLARGRG